MFCIFQNKYYCLYQQEFVFFFNWPWPLKMKIWIEKSWARGQEFLDHSSTVWLGNCAPKGNYNFALQGDSFCGISKDLMKPCRRMSLTRKKQERLIMMDCKNPPLWVQKLAIWFAWSARPQKWASKPCYVVLNDYQINVKTKCVLKKENVSCWVGALLWISTGRGLD